MQKNISLENLSTYTAQLKAKYAKKADIPTKVSDLANDAGFQTGEQVTAAISAKVSSAYRAGGSAAFADMPELTEANLGLVVNVTEKFTTTDSFVEGAGKKHPAGTNVAVVQVGEEYKYDALAGFVDLSGYAETEQVAADIDAAKSAANSYTDTQVAGCVKAEDIEPVTEAEILALFADEAG